MTGAGFGLRAGTSGTDRSGVGAGLTAILAAATAAYLLLHGSLVLALAFCALPLLLMLVVKPAVGVVLLGASVPVMYDLTGGRGGFHLAVSDLLLVLVAAGVILAGALVGEVPALRALKPVRRAASQYAVFLFVLLAAHLSISDLAQTGQRIELFVLPLIIGAFAALAGRHLAVLKAYVLAATLLALLWPVDQSLGQKNPVGQMIGNAILILIGVRSLRRYAPLAVVLVPGLLLTASRGAVVATGLGVAVVFAFENSRGSRLFSRLAVVAALALVAYAMLPVSVQDRLTTFSAGTGSRAAIALRIRQQYTSDAKKIIRQHPAVGIGVGNYLAGDPRTGTQTTDPHNVLLLEAAEGGYLFAISFIALVAGAVLALRRMRGVELAPVAAAVLLATVVHGLVDVYWVRGTPLLGWLLVGMACGVAAGKSHASPRPAHAA